MCIHLFWVQFRQWLHISFQKPPWTWSLNEKPCHTQVWNTKLLKFSIKSLKVCHYFAFLKIYFDQSISHTFQPYHMYFFTWTMSNNHVVWSKIIHFWLLQQKHDEIQYFFKFKKTKIKTSFKVAARKRCLKILKSHRFWNIPKHFSFSKVSFAKGKMGSGKSTNIMLVNCFLSDCFQQCDNVGHFTFAHYF